MKKFLSMILVLVIALSLASCSIFDDGEKVETHVDPTAIPPETEQELYSYYNQVRRGMTREDVEALFGEGEPRYDADGLETYITYKNEKKSAGVSVVYSSMNTVAAKILYYNNDKDLIKFCTPFTDDKLEKLDQDMLVKNAKEILGNGLELSCEFSANNPNDFSKIYSWFNPDGRSLQLYTDNDIIKQMVLNKED